jgi:spore maturation protein CgeB
MVTSSCPDTIAATAIVLASRAPRRVFYDLDTLRTLEQLPPDGLREFDLVLSRAGGPALALLEERLGARRALPLYACVDPDALRPASPSVSYEACLSVLASWSPDRDDAFARLFLDVASALPRERFLVGGALYRGTDLWPHNVRHVEHIRSRDLQAFYSQCRFTLSLSRAATAKLGHGPSPRLFEAAACGTPLLSDDWPGLSDVLTPGEEVLVVKDARDVLAALTHDDRDRARLAEAARARVLARHTAAVRAAELVDHFEAESPT